jgi:hypothetical protein
MAHRIISLLRGNLVALGTRRKSDELRLQNQVMSTRPRLSGKSVRLPGIKSHDTGSGRTNPTAPKIEICVQLQADLGRPVLAQKIFPFAFPSFAGFLIASRLKQEGRTRDRHDTRGGDAVDAVASGAFARDDWRNGGRRSRVVLAPQGWR